MGDRANRMAAIVAALTAACPTRVVTRDYQDIGRVSAADLTAGRITVLGQGEGKYQNLRGRPGQDSQQRIMLIGQLKVAETESTSTVEDAEFALFEEILAAFAAAQGYPLNCLDLVDFTQSGGLEAPYGWFTVDLHLHN